MHEKLHIGPVLLILFAAVLLRSQPQPQSVPLPAEVQTALDTCYPGWKFAEASLDAYETYRRNHFPFRPNFIWGDFDGDGRRDYAAQIVRPAPKDEQQIVVVFLRRGKGFETHVLETSILSSDSYLWPHKKGERDFDFEREKYFWYQHDAVGVVYGEVAGVSYVFENGKFRKIVSSD